MSAARGSRLLIAATLACLGLALSAQAANATYARLTIVKINQGGDPADAFAFHPLLTPSRPDFALVAGEANEKTLSIHCNTDLPGRACSSHPRQQVSELPAVGYALQDVRCVHTQGSGAYAGEPTASSPADDAATVSGATVDVKAAFKEWVKCYFTNAPAVAAGPVRVPAAPPGAPPSSPPANPTPPDQSAQPQAPQLPQIEVSPETVRPGTARILGPPACPTTRAASVAVVGRNIAKVAFYVDGRKVTTLIGPNGSAGRWTLALRLGQLSVGTQRVEAHVTFTRSSGTKPKILRLSVSRCHRGVVAPSFTG